MWRVVILIYYVLLLSMVSDAQVFRRNEKIVICQKWSHLETPTNLKPLLTYTERYGYDLKLFYYNETLFAKNIKLDSSWSKIFAIYTLLTSERYDWVVFIDSSTNFARRDLPIESLFEPPNKNSYLVLTLDNLFLDPNFQIWKNTFENQELIRRWLSLSREGSDEMLRFATESPYEAGIFPFLFLPKEKPLDYYHIKLFPGNMFWEQINSAIRTNTTLSSQRNDSSPLELSSIEPFLYELTPFHFAHYLAIPVPRFSFTLVIPDHENEDFEFTVIISWGDQNDGDYLWIKPSLLEKLFSGCLDQVQNRTSCNYFFNRLQDNFQELRTQYDYYRGLEVVEKYKRRYPRWSQLVDEEKANFQPFLQSQRADTPPNHLDYHHPKVIVTIFAGRKHYLELVMKYWMMALKLNIIHEIHLWDYVFGAKAGDINHSDRSYIHSLMNPAAGVYVKMRFTLRKAYSDYYEYYANYGRDHPEDIIIKCDDDLVFIDVLRLPYFLSFLTSNDENKNFNGILLANIINHPTATQYQQVLWNIFPTELGIQSVDLPEYSNLLGPLWSSGEMADRIHEHFLQHWENIIRPIKSLNYSPETIGPIKDRFCINFFAVKASNFFKLQDIGADDEFFLTVTLPQAGILENHLVSNFFVTHMAYRAQLREMNISAHLARYYQLFETYANY